MYNVLVNALSVTNQSGLHVLCGHLDRLTAGCEARCRFHVLHRKDQGALIRAFEGRVEWIVCPDETRHWFGRAAWEYRKLAGVAASHDIHAYFTPSGIGSSALRIPQIVFCQNPWALVPEARSRHDALKALIQRRAYRSTMRAAEVMIFNSRFMQEAYRSNAGFPEKRGLVVYQAPDDETHAAGSRSTTPRIRGRIVCVSAMGAHKNIEAIVGALCLLKQNNVKDAHLHLIGSWPDPAYEQKIRRLVESRGLAHDVRFDGFVTREELNRRYAGASVFCLMSRCESFGIPAVEAQCFGTPVVTSDVCAVPEICGNGGVFVDPDDIPGLARALGRLLDDQEEWERISRAARENAARFTWTACSRPLADLFLELSGA